ncbi:MAG: TetR/AcrR family transcriptional regulator [Candidatus Abyssobacteria bacterium SURF_5]|uniref:TetR/AcrR family transcriptional regulator n=1 Tax=Abyssobacteria bacterium (strain SURF_5) TaxID=2093360 RepID=A0A3A4P8G4_ABYX5|nr:MAG: TetR/AcrR family transcriptional regulator [Candidatus Abyssubacteria bacterium SURF_5]
MGRKSIAHIRREQIINGFFKVVAKKGFANASTREITEAAGVSKGVLHHYFIDKEAMVLGVLGHVLETYLAEFTEGLEKRESPTEQMEFFWSWFLDLNRFNMEFSRAWVEFWVLSKTNESIAEALRDCYGQIIGRLAGIIRKGIESGDFAKVDPLVTANTMLASLEGTTMLWVVNPMATPVEAINDKIAELFLNHLKPGQEN